MTQRSILAGTNPTVIIKTGASVTVTGVEGERVSAQTGGRWGLKVVRKRKKEVIEVQIGGSGEVTVPLASNLKVYAGKDLHVRDIRGRVDAYAGFKLSLQDVYCLGNASAGWTMDVDCQTLAGEQVTYTAGSDLRFHVQDLTSARLRVKDLGGYWEARIGQGEKSVYLKSGGDVTLVTDQKVEPLPPHYILGNIEKPPVAG
jgi:hypothetical protein